jgi:hypothetical protein
MVGQYKQNNRPPPDLGMPPCSDGGLFVERMMSSSAWLILKHTLPVLDWIQGFQSSEVPSTRNATVGEQHTASSPHDVRPSLYGAACAPETAV